MYNGAKRGSGSGHTDSTTRDGSCCSSSTEVVVWVLSVYKPRTTAVASIMIASVPSTGLATVAVVSIKAVIAIPSL